MTGRGGRPAALCVALLVPWGCGGGGRDVVPASKDVVGDAPTAGDAGAEGYAYVARRPLAVVALADARGIDPQVARAAVDGLADVVQSCVSDEGRKGAVVDGAARVILQIDAKGAVANAGIRVDPKPGTGTIAVVCLLSPARLLTFPPADQGDRGIAIEALWGAGPAR